MFTSIKIAAAPILLKSEYAFINSSLIKYCKLESRVNFTGNFKNLVYSINYDPAMLYWLDNDKNYFINENNNTINENYSR